MSDGRKQQEDKPHCTTTRVTTRVVPDQNEVWLDLGIANRDQLKNKDLALHLDCKKQAVLAFMDLHKLPLEYLYYGALEDTRDIAAWTLGRQGYKWAFPTRYVAEQDWSLLGVETYRMNKIDNFNDFIEFSREELAKGWPVMFYAPGDAIEFFLDLRRKHAVVPEELHDPHAFFVCAMDQEAQQFQFFEAPTLQRFFFLRVMRWWLTISIIPMIGLKMCFRCV